MNAYIVMRRNEDLGGQLEGRLYDNDGLKTELVFTPEAVASSDPARVRNGVLSFIRKRLGKGVDVDVYWPTHDVKKWQMTTLGRT